MYTYIWRAGQAARRRANKLAREKAREEEIKAEVAQMRDPRAEENILLTNKLGGLKLSVKEIQVPYYVT